MTDTHTEAGNAGQLISLKIRRAEIPDDRAACMRIRMEVFVDEQQVPPDEEIDGIDDDCIHYIARDEFGPLGTARVIPKGGTAKIGRVAVVRSARGRKIGSELMRFVIGDAILSGFTEAVLDSQTHAIAFYERLGFVAEGDEFLDAGIPHYRMRRTLEHRGAAS